jgi:hypothetical protein
MPNLMRHRCLTLTPLDAAIANHDVFDIKYGV